MPKPRPTVFGRTVETLGMNMIIEKEVNDLEFNILK